MNLRRAQPAESREVAEWIRTHHYLDELPPAYRFALEVMNGRERIGAFLLGLPPRGYDQTRWLALWRVYFIDATAPNVESQGLAMMRRFVRVWVPSTRMLVSYSDPEQGHEGVIYEADGWAYDRNTRGGGEGWTNRPGRRSGGGKRTPKLRWLRTP